MVTGEPMYVHGAVLNFIDHKLQTSVFHMH